MSGAAALPAAATAPPAPPKRSGSRCCLVSCGGCLLLILLLAVAAWLGFHWFAAPWLAARKADLVTRFPALQSMLHVEKALETLGDGVRIAGGATGSADPADFPDDIYIPGPHRLATFDTTESEALAFLELEAAGAAVVAATIRREMARRGWERLPVPDPHDGIALRFEKAERSASYEIIPRREGTEVWIRSP